MSDFIFNVASDEQIAPIEGHFFTDFVDASASKLAITGTSHETELGSATYLFSIVEYEQDQTLYGQVDFYDTTGDGVPNIAVEQWPGEGMDASESETLTISDAGVVTVGAVGDGHTVQLAFNDANEAVGLFEATDGDMGSAPAVTAIAVTDGTYGVGDSIVFTVTFDMPVAVSDAGATPQLKLALDSSTFKYATYDAIATSGLNDANKVAFSYTVALGDSAADLDVVALEFAGAISETIDGYIASNVLPEGFDFAGAQAVVVDAAASTDPMVYEWSTQTILADSVLADDYQATADDLAAIDMNDVLATLSLASGSNPNASFVPSPYQYMAADVNEDGVVSAFDALDILKMSAGMSSAPKVEFDFVSENFDFWNESVTDSVVYSIDESDVDWTSIDASISGATDNLVAVLKGDVDGSWTSSTLNQTVQSSHFTQLLNDDVAPYDQFFLTI